MTSVGYGDLGPKNILERVVCTAIVLVAGLCWAQILGDVCAISSVPWREALILGHRSDTGVA